MWERKPTWRVDMRHNFASDEIELRFGKNEFDGNTGKTAFKIAKPVELVACDPGKNDEPWASFSRSEMLDGVSWLQEIVDAAWDIGVRPKRAAISENEMQAIRYHLEDMRQIAGVKK